MYEIDRIFRSISLAHIPEREPLSGILNLRKKFNKGVGQGHKAWVKGVCPCARRVGVCFPELKKFVSFCIAL